MCLLKNSSTVLIFNVLHHQGIYATFVIEFGTLFEQKLNSTIVKIDVIITFADYKYVIF